MHFHSQRGLLKQFQTLTFPLFPLIHFVWRTHTVWLGLFMACPYVLWMHWYGLRPVSLVRHRARPENDSGGAVSHCGFASGGLSKQIAPWLSVSRTNLHALIQRKQPALFSSIPTPRRRFIWKASGLIKWKWHIITRMMKAAMSRHYTLAYLWYFVMGAALYRANACLFTP